MPPLCCSFTAFGHMPVNRVEYLLLKDDEETRKTEKIAGSSTEHVMMLKNKDDKKTHEIKGKRRNTWKIGMLKIEHLVKLT